MGSPFPPRKIEKACAVHRHQSEKKYSKEYLSEKTERQRSFGVNGYSFKSVETVSLCALVISSSFLRDLHSGSAG